MKNDYLKPNNTDAMKLTYGTKKVSYFKLLNDLVSIEPVYDKNFSKFSKIYTSTGDFKLLSHSIKKIQSDYCYANLRELHFTKKLSELTLNRKSLIPIKVTEKKTLLPIKTLKEPVNRDNCYSYILFEAIEDIDYDNKIIFFKGNNKMNFLERDNTINIRIGQCNILKNSTYTL